jgi:DUF971 family protein
MSKNSPVNIILHQKSHTVDIEFSNGKTYAYPFELLRVFSPSAEVRGHWGQGAKLQVEKQNVVITDIQQVGQYAVKFFYDDGHHSGIYDWDYLYDLGHKQALYWNDYLQRLNTAGLKPIAATWQ